MGVYKRKRKDRVDYWISFQVDKRQVQEKSGTDRREAERLLARRRREVAEGTYDPDAGAGQAPTLRSFAKRYFDANTKRAADTDRARYRDHIDPALGRHRLDAITPKMVAAWVEDMKLEGQLAPKTIRNVHGVLSAILGDAQLGELVERNSAKGLPRGILPPLKSKKQPVPYSRDELAVMLGHPAVPPDVRVLIALMGLAGLRLGEACGRRWRDLGPAEPLWRLRVHTQYDDQPLKTAEYGDAKERIVPVHPLLRSILSDWYHRGFEAMLGRAPRPEDPITPWPARMTTRRENQAGKAADKAIGAAGIEKIPGRRVHALRRSFISLARSDGARGEILETVTHNAKGEIIDVYTTYEWAACCEAVSALTIEPLEKMPEKEAPNAADLDRAAAPLDPLTALESL